MYCEGPECTGNLVWGLSKKWSPDLKFDNFILPTCFFQYCGETGSKIAAEVKKEAAAAAIAIRKTLLQNIKLVNILLDTYAAFDLSINQLLRG